MVALLAGGAIVGVRSAKVGRRLPPMVLRAAIVVIGDAGTVQLVG